MRYKLIIAYDGAGYHGWQVQPNGISIQEILIEKLEMILQYPIRLIGSGRTDAGVHALGQTAHFDSDKSIDCKKLLHSLNAVLPKDIRILSLEEVIETFHAQYSATSKVYRYHLYLRPILSPFRKKWVWHVPFLKDLDAMREASGYFLGKHDFTAFANEAHVGVAAHDPIRTLSRLDWIMDQEELILEFEADGFLYKMVRNIVGTLVECGSKKLEPKKIIEILASKDRRQAGQAAPPQGLVLVRVSY